VKSVGVGGRAGRLEGGGESIVLAVVRLVMSGTIEIVRGWSLKVAHTK